MELLAPNDKGDFDHAGPREVLDHGVPLRGPLTKVVVDSGEELITQVNGVL